MMLSSTAGSLFWTGRYLERADFVARLLDATLRLATLPSHDDEDANPWPSALATAAATDSFAACGRVADEEQTSRFLAYDPLNPSSILSCLDRARSNARATRTALTAETWGAINDAWLETRRATPGRVTRAGTQEFIERAKQAVLLYEGAVQRTQLRDDSYNYLCLGAAVERADNTARLLDVKYHLLLPEGEAVGGGLDYFQWSTILRTVGAAGAYRWVYRDELKPWLVADLLILNRRMPRSLAACADQASRHLDALARSSGRRGPGQRLAGAMLTRLGEASIERVIQEGLHGYITRFLAENNALGSAIAEQYGF